jgi:ribosomal protein S18 acetylase RimI-like enzyme
MYRDFAPFFRHRINTVFPLILSIGELTKNRMSVTYRVLAPGDAKQYREIRLESLKLHPESFGTGYEEQSKLSKLMFEKAIEEPVDDRFVIGAFDNRELVGICGFLPFVTHNDLDLSDSGEIIQMYVKSMYRGKRIGLRLVEAVIHEALKLPGIMQILLGVAEGNTSAIRVYEQA